MRPLEMKTPGRGNGAGAGEMSVESGIDKANGTPHVPTCYCRPGHTCGWHHLRSRIDEAFARARSLRLQAVGEPGRGGAWS